MRCSKNWCNAKYSVLCSFQQTNSEEHVMATLVQNNRNKAFDFSSLKAVASFFGDIGRAGHAASRYQHLAALNDRQLASLGCDRETAARAAYEESFGKL